MDYIKELLHSLKELKPIETGVEPEYRFDETVKAVIFDIYGTLLVSSSGDIEQAEMTTKVLRHALEKSNIEIVKDSDETLQHVLHDFEYTISICHNEAKKNNVPYPEIDILTIWEIVLIHARRKNLISFNGDANILRMTCVFEFLSNLVYPMPGMQKTISELSNANIPLGIVSNAQFYTPVLMNHFLNNKLSLEEKIDRFDWELTVYSYKLGMGKPDTYLFKELIPVLNKKYGLQPNQVMFVGNDMLKDIYTASQVGFKTALFAGDKRSLRTREDDKRINGLKPDHIITELSQIKEIVGI